MKNKITLLILAISAGLYSLPSMAVGSITSATATPNPATIVNGLPAPVDITVHVNMGVAFNRTCEVIITSSEGTNLPRLMFGFGQNSTQVVHHHYRAPGTYQVTVKGYGSNGCDGTHNLTVTVQSGSPRVSAVTPMITAKNNFAPTCPMGWSLIPSSVNGAQYSCRANAPQMPLNCGGNTKYFYDNGVIGCK